MIDELLLIVFTLFIINIVPFSVTTFMGKKNMVAIFGGIQLILSILLILLASRGW